MWDTVFLIIVTNTGYNVGYGYNIQLLGTSHLQVSDIMATMSVILVYWSTIYAI